MNESAVFLRSLQHNNPDRPRFAIGQGANAMLAISFQGAEINVPMAEILAFAQRWNSDREVRANEMQLAGNLAIFPYPLYCVRIDDPDAVGIGWD